MHTGAALPWGLAWVMAWEMPGAGPACQPRGGHTVLQAEQGLVLGCCRVGCAHCGGWQWVALCA